MNCPACNQQLREIQAGDIAIELCQNGCGGIWFDWLELKKFDEAHEFVPPAVLSAQTNTPVKDDIPLRYCPKCPDNEVLCRRWYDIKNEVEIDQCLACSGIWLDTKEIEIIRAQFKTEAERLAASDAWLATHLEAAKVALDDELMRDMNIDRARLERYKAPGIEPSALTAVLRALLLR